MYAISFGTKRTKIDRFCRFIINFYANGYDITRRIETSI